MNNNKNQKILAIDLGTNTGWAIRSQNNQITSGTKSFKPQRFEGGGMRYLRFVRWLEEINQLSEGIDQIYFEEVRRHLGVDAAHAYGGFLAHLSSWCEERNIPYLGIPVGTIKKHITNKGNAGKAEVMNEVKKLGFNPIDDNEADALALLHLVVKEHVGGYHDEQ
jgi:Holliday junction resolvasome RuvABC endonuclease subunit